MSQEHQSCPPWFPPAPSSSTHGGRAAVPTQLRRAPGRQQVPAGLSCPPWGSEEATGQQRGSVGQNADLGLGCHTPAPLWAQGWGSRGLTTFTPWVRGAGRRRHQVLLLRPHEASPEVGRQGEEPSHHLGTEG